MTEMITSASSLPSISDMGESETNTLQINSQRQINGSNFRQGVIDYSFSLAGNQRASMKKSYVRLRAKIVKTNGDAPVLADKVGFAENWANNLFSSAYFYAGGVDISSKQNFVAQSSMARTRLSATKSWFDSIGEVYGFNSNFSERAAEVSADGNTDFDYFGANSIVLTGTITGQVVPDLTGVLTLGADYPLVVGDSFVDGAGKAYVVTGITTPNTVFTIEADTTIPTAPAAGDIILAPKAMGLSKGLDDGNNDIEIVFQPGALGIWDTESCLPSGQFRLSLYPQNDESLTGGIESTLPGVTAGNYKIEVDSMYLYLHTYRAVEPIVNGKYFLDLNEMSTQVKTLSSATNNNFNLTIPASTFGIAVWSQAKNAGTTPAMPPSIFDNQSKQLLHLHNVQLTYAGISKPNTNWDSAIGGVAMKSWLRQRYHDTMCNAGLADLSCETFDDWLKRGVLLYYSWIKSDDNRSTELQLSIDYEDPSPAVFESSHIFVGALHRNLVEIMVESGYTTSIRKLSA